MNEYTNDGSGLDWYIHVTYNTKKLLYCRVKLHGTTMRNTSYCVHNEISPHRTNGLLLSNRTCGNSKHIKYYLYNCNQYMNDAKDYIV